MRRQGVKEAAVLDEPAPGLPLKGGRGQLAVQLREHLGQQRRVEQMLGFGETAQAHRPGADLLRHALQWAGGTEAAHGLDDRIEQAEEKQAQVIGVLQKTLRVGPGGGERSARRRLRQAGAEILDQTPAPQIGGRELSLDGAATHAESSAEAAEVVQ